MLVWLFLVGDCGGCGACCMMLWLLSVSLPLFCVAIVAFARPPEISKLLLNESEQFPQAGWISLHQTRLSFQFPAEWSPLTYCAITS